MRVFARLSSVNLFSIWVMLLLMTTLGCSSPGGGGESGGGVECLDNGDCQDGDPCTADGCTSNTCFHWPVDDCGAGLDGYVPDPKHVAEAEEALSAQQGYSAELAALLEMMDVDSATQQIAQQVSADASVEWAQADSTGVSIQYANGMRGGLVVDLDDLDSEYEVAEAKGILSPALPVARAVTETSTRTVFLNPSYWERERYADAIMNAAEDALPQAGLQPFDNYLTEAATVERFASLDGYGLIHIYSHGKAWPTKDDPEEVYLLTGEVYNGETLLNFFGDVLLGNLAVFTRTEPWKGQKNPSLFYVGPGFVTRHNNLSDEQSLVFLGFCHSFRGSWQESLIDIGASACIGFDWAVGTKRHSDWAIELYTNMADTSRLSPLTLEEWYSELEETGYVREKDGHVVNLQIHGDGGLTLWPDETEGSSGAGDTTLPETISTECAVLDGNWVLMQDYCVEDTGDPCPSFDSVYGFDSGVIRTMETGAAATIIADGLEHVTTDSSGVEWTYAIQGGCTGAGDSTAVTWAGMMESDDEQLDTDFSFEVDSVSSDRVDGWARLAANGMAGGRVPAYFVPAHTGGMGSCAGSYTGTFTGWGGGELSATVSEDGVFSGEFTFSEDEGVSRLVGAILNDGTLIGSSGTLGEFDFTACTASGTWWSGEFEAQKQ